MKQAILLLLVISSCIGLYAQLPQPSTGSIIRHENFSSKHVTARNVDVWLPGDYSDKKKYAVLYMQDGQMLFDSNSTWNKQAWEVDDMLGKLLQEKKIQDVIVVGVWNSDKGRHADYLPQKPFETLTSQQQDSLYVAKRSNGLSVFNGIRVHSDNYLKFLVTELKPFIDKTYSTYTDRKRTFIAGSSMGGLISLYAICEYPQVFGGAACLSTHWPGIFSMANNPVPGAIITYLKKKLPNPQTHKIYFDYGDQALDTLYPPIQKKVDVVMKAKRFSQKNWVTKYYPGENHSEAAWRKRLKAPMLFLLQ